MADDTMPSAAVLSREATSVAPANDAIVDKWVRTFIYGSVVSRDTGVFNYLTTVAVIELKRLLAAEGKP